MAEAMQSANTKNRQHIKNANKSMITMKKYEEIDRIQKTLKLDGNDN